MQLDSTRLYRVRTVAESLDVSVATIYRAVESGALRAVRMGTRKGAVRIPGQAIREYVAACERAAATSPRVALPVPQGLACVTCGLDLRGRLIVPAKVIEAVIEAAADSGALVEAAAVVPGGEG
jgi:excisionase family DNA binding protein